MVWLQGGLHNISDICRANRVRIEMCQAFIACMRSGQVGLRLINPRSNVTVTQNPAWDWEPIENADAYEILITSSQGETLKFLTPTNRFSIESPLAKGKTYRVQLIAYKGETAIATLTHSLWILSDAQVQNLATTINQINGLRLTPDQEAEYIDAAYANLGLVEEAIAYLEKQPPTPANLRLLGDRYLLVGDRAKAAVAYRQMIGETTGDLRDYGVEMLAVLESYNQLPSNTKLPQ
jgi:hypothetical protein